MRKFKHKRKLKRQAPDCPICGKRSFWSSGAAAFFMLTYKAKRVYKCQFCGYYHVTNKKFKKT